MAARATNNATFFKTCSSVRGLTAGTSLYPFRGMSSLRRILIGFRGISAEIEAAPASIRAYVAILVATATAVVTSLALTHQTFGNAWSVGALAVVAVIAERGSVRLTSTTEESISLLPTLFAGVLFGPLAAATVGAASMLGDARRPFLRWMVYTSTRLLTGATVGALAVFVHSEMSSRLSAVAVATALCAIVAETLDAFFAAVTH